MNNGNFLDYKVSNMQGNIFIYCLSKNMFYQPTEVGEEQKKKKKRKERKGWRERWADWSLANSEHRRKGGPLGIDPK